MSSRTLRASLWLVVLGFALLTVLGLVHVIDLTAPVLAVLAPAGIVYAVWAGWALRRKEHEHRRT